MMLAADILTLPELPHNPSRYLVLVPIATEDNVMRVGLGQRVIKEKVIVSAQYFPCLRPPVTVLEEIA